MEVEVVVEVVKKGDLVELVFSSSCFFLAMLLTHFLFCLPACQPWLQLSPISWQRRQLQLSTISEQRGQLHLAVLSMHFPFLISPTIGWDQSGFA